MYNNHCKISSVWSGLVFNDPKKILFCNNMLFIPKQFRKVQSIHMLFYRHDMYCHITQASPKTCSNALNTFELIKKQPIIYQNWLANAIFPLVCALLFFHVTWTQIWMMHCFNFNQQVQLTMTPSSYLIPYKPLIQCWSELYSCSSHAGMLGLRGGGLSDL